MRQVNEYEDYYNINELLSIKKHKDIILYAKIPTNILMIQKVNLVMHQPQPHH